MSKKLANSQLTNFLTLEKYRRELLTLSENVFNFTNLPVLIDTAFLNKTLLRKGAIAFFYDEELESVLALPYRTTGELDLYGRPVGIEVHGKNGYHKELAKDEYVIMYDNEGRISLYFDILQHAERIANIKRVIDINIAQQKTPRIWKTKTETERTVKDLLNDYEGNVEQVIGYDSAVLDNLEAVIAPAPYVADKLNDALREEFSEFFQLIGIASVEVKKKERMITDEMRSSLGGTIASRFSRFNPRKKAIDEINKKWGTKIEVEYYDGLPTSLETVGSDNKKEVKNNDVLQSTTNNQ